MVGNVKKLIFMRSRSTKIQTLRLNISGTVGAIEVILLPNERCSPKVSTYVLKQRSSLGGQGQGQGHLKVITQMDSKLKNIKVTVVKHVKRRSKVKVKVKIWVILIH